MGTNAPTIVTLPVSCAPKKAPCPTCGKPGRRRRTLPPRRVRTVAYKAIAYLEITCGEYQARCDCCTTFRNTPEGVLPRALYDNKVRDLPVAFALVKTNDQDHMRRFLQNLKNWGLMPRTVITDGSNLYPAVLAELWSEADHQLCVFHIVKEINQLILDALRRLRNAMRRRGRAGRKKKRGRKGAKSKAAARRGSTLKEKSSFVFKHRHLIVKRQEKLTESERDDLRRMLEYLPGLATLRRFADRIYWLFDTPKDYHQASCRRATIVRDPTFRAVPELVRALEQLSPEKFPKVMAYLNNPVSQRVRTNNHVERTNRMVRFLEKVRYKWRRRKTLVRFVVLRLDHIWSHWLPAEARKPNSSPILRRPKTQAHTEQEPRRVA